MRIRKTGSGAQAQKTFAPIYIAHFSGLFVITKCETFEKTLVFMNSERGTGGNVWEYGGVGDGN